MLYCIFKKIIFILIIDYLGGKVVCFSIFSSVVFIIDYIRILNFKIVKDIYKIV